MNVFTAVGHVGQDAELKYTPQGKAVAVFSLAIDNGKDQDGEKRPPTWVQCTLWEKRAEALAQHIRKGKIVAVSGPIGIETWIRKDGAAGGRIVMNVHDFTFGSASQEPEHDNGAGKKSPAPAAQKQRA